MILALKVKGFQSKRCISPFKEMLTDANLGAGGANMYVMQCMYFLLYTVHMQCMQCIQSIRKKEIVFYVPVQIYRSISIPIRFLGDVMILMSPLSPLRHVVASQVVKEATEAFLFIGAGDAWRALGQQRLSDLSETSGTPGPQNDLTWTERDFLTGQNHPDTAKCI